MEQINNQINDNDPNNKNSSFRFGARGGVVAILVRHDINVVSDNFNYNNDGLLETLVIKTRFDHTNCNKCVIYNPTKTYLN